MTPTPKFLPSWIITLTHLDPSLCHGPTLTFLFVAVSPNGNTGLFSWKVRISDESHSLSRGVASAFPVRRDDLAATYAGYYCGVVSPGGCKIRALASGETRVGRISDRPRVANHEKSTATPPKATMWRAGECPPPRVTRYVGTERYTRTRNGHNVHQYYNTRPRLFTGSRQTVHYTLLSFFTDIERLGRIAWTQVMCYLQALGNTYMQLTSSRYHCP